MADRFDSEKNISDFGYVPNRFIVIKEELKKIYKNINNFYDYLDFIVIETDTKFIEIITSLFKLSEESNKLEKIIINNKFFV